MKTPRIYLDTSVFGGCFDEEFAKDSLRLIEEIKAGKFRLLISDSVLAELDSAPTVVQEVWKSIPAQQVETVVCSAEGKTLAHAYVKAKVVGPASTVDAEHIAIATISGADMIVSWNFKHIVHFEKIAGYSSVNKEMGYAAISIYSPKEVVSYEDQDI